MPNLEILDAASTIQAIQAIARDTSRIREELPPNTDERGEDDSPRLYARMREVLVPGGRAEADLVYYDYCEDRWRKTGDTVKIFDRMRVTFALPCDVVTVNAIQGEWQTYKEFNLKNIRIEVFRKLRVDQIEAQVLLVRGDAIARSGIIFANVDITPLDTNEVAPDDQGFMSYDTDADQWVLHELLDSPTQAVNIDPYDLFPPNCVKSVDDVDVTTSTTTTLDPATFSDCEGECVWEWNDSTKEWELQTDGCSNATTTSTSTSSTTTSTTTPDPTTTTRCPTTTSTTGGPTSTTSTTSTTTTTTTTPAPCGCLYPTECGTVNGETIRTFCVSGDENVPPDCTGTTTTCECTTTTTTLDPGECTGCDFVCEPFAAGWVLLNFGCTQLGNCLAEPCGTCPFPSEPCTLANACEEVSTSCFYCPPPDPPPPPPCQGTCHWFWIPQLDSWVFAGGGCIGGGGCNCRPPSEPGDDCGPASTGCATSGTTGDPCDYNCTSTTTSDDGCQSDCRWRESGGVWTLEDDPCNNDVCPCAEPAYDPTTGEIAYTFCGSAPTSTTSTGAPTTSTQDPGIGACCIGGVNEQCLELDPSQCTGLGGDYQGAGTFCIPDPCEIGGTTSTSTTSTTTSTTGDPITGACCNIPPDDECIITTAENCNALQGSWVGGNVTCDICDPEPCQAGDCLLECLGGIWTLGTSCPNFECVCVDPGDCPSPCETGDFCVGDCVGKFGPGGPQPSITP